MRLAQISGYQWYLLYDVAANKYSEEEALISHRPRYYDMLRRHTRVFKRLLLQENDETFFDIGEVLLFCVTACVICSRDYSVL